jgi:hypothetical protein
MLNVKNFFRENGSSKITGINGDDQKNPLLGPLKGHSHEIDF